MSNSNSFSFKLKMKAPFVTPQILSSSQTLIGVSGVIFGTTDPCFNAIL